MRALFLTLLGFLVGCSNSADITWKSITSKIHEDFPKVEEITVGELEQIMTAGDDLHLYDVRAPEEYAVSHIDSAENLESADLIAAAVLDKDALIVAYCSVGYRSGVVAEGLRSLGYTRVYNLKGSIFEWANEGKPVVLKGEEAEYVHPFSEEWGVLLDEGLRSYEASR